MTQFDDIFKGALNEILPTKQEIEKHKEIIDFLTKLLTQKAKELGITFKFIEPQGSTGIKQTQLRNTSDIDLFIGMDFKSFMEEKISKTKLKQKLKSKFRELCETWIIKAIEKHDFKNIILLYAEHPYVSAEYIDSEGITEIDIVLCFALSKEYLLENGPITAVDRTPWHTRFVRDNLTKEQKNEVRLLKQFFKCCYSYGDKSPVGRIGFIGYSSELLIYHFRNLLNLFEHFDELEYQSIDFFSRNTKELKKKPRFINDFLIIIDPTDKNRNVAAAISKKAYYYCKDKVKQFLKDPDISYFQIKSLPIVDFNLVKKEAIFDHLFLIEFKNENLEVHYTELRDKLYSFGEKVKSSGEIEKSKDPRFGKITFEVYFETDKSFYAISFFCENPKISEKFLRRGPPVKEKLHAKQFKKKNPNYLLKENFLYIEEKRRFIKFLDFLNDISINKAPKEFDIINVSNCYHAKTDVGKRCVYVLKEMVLPYIK